MKIQDSGAPIRTEPDTRRTVLRLLLERGALTASAIAYTLGITPEGVRRHIDNLIAAGFVDVDDSRRRLKEKTRGRPPQYFRLTESGRQQFGDDYESLAVSALIALRDIGGEEAIQELAERRVRCIMDAVHSRSESHQSIAQSIDEITEAFRSHGYVASVEFARGDVQICRHHCPIADVARHFPEFCHAEHTAIAGILGHHVQALATIAHGHQVCTINVPLSGHHSPTPAPDLDAQSRPDRDAPQLGAKPLP